ncbi:hypothetical protein [Nocardia ignorata]|uniref:Uncharacterized protein n=1 Tax=Nocardia ignorata TaxID=145285 RepID=A0A4R6P0C4_NOCIG|nr:hypothetical protein [Nocardia ignorata]TDP29835.1 hypothetical protein DFR75_112103 [Nocardia ignorata]
MAHTLIADFVTDLRAELTVMITARGTADLANDLEDLAVLGDAELLDDAGRLVRSLIAETLHNRHLEVAAALDAWIDNDNSDDEAAVIVRAARDLVAA